MCPPQDEKRARKPPRSRRRESMENYKVMRWLDEERQRNGLSLRDVAAALGPGYRNATRVAQYFDQRIVAGPDMLQRLAIAVGVSPIDALWNAGHHGAVLDYLDKLYRLGWWWADHDRVAVHQESGADFMLQYAESGFPDDGDLRIPPANLAHRYHLATVYKREGKIFRVVSLPKPMAVAILLTVALFPRRGDQLRAQTKALYEPLSLIASKMMPAAELARVPPNHGFGFRKPIKDAEAVWKYRFLGPMRLAIIGEYIQRWCEFICRDYTDYARLALYEQGGFIGGSKKDEMISEEIWEWQKTSMPSVDELRMEPTEE